MSEGKRKNLREVVGVISPTETLKMTMPPRGTVELREDSKGRWIVSYPDPGFVPCSPTCDLGRVVRGHKHDYQQKQITSTYQPETYEAARAWAEELAEGFEIKVVPYQRGRKSEA